MPNFASFEQKIGTPFNDQTLLRQAFTHRSYINENRNVTWGHNERLEFLGDAVIELITTEHLYQKYPNVTEGDLTSYRAALVNAVTLSNVALNLGMNDYLLLSRGEAKDTGRARQFILANTFEAVVGAIYLDQGYSAAEQFITAHVLPLTDEIVEKRLWQDAKSRLQELAQEKEGVTPSYETEKQEGPDHNKQFTVGVFLNKEKIGEGSGKSKQEAEQEAAQKALNEKGWA